MPSTPFCIAAMTDQNQLLVSQRVPAWKRIGLKLKSSQEALTAATDLTHSRSLPIGTHGASVAQNAHFQNFDQVPSSDVSEVQLQKSSKLKKRSHEDKSNQSKAKKIKQSEVEDSLAPRLENGNHESTLSQNASIGTSDPLMHIHESRK